MMRCLTEVEAVAEVDSTDWTQETIVVEAFDVVQLDEVQVVRSGYQVEQGVTVDALYHVCLDANIPVARQPLQSVVAD